MFYSCKINNEYIFNLLGWSVEDFNSSNILNLETSDLITVKEVFNNVQLVQIYFGDNLIASYSQFNGYPSLMDIKVLNLEIIFMIIKEKLFLTY